MVILPQIWVFFHKFCGNLHKFVEITKT